MQIIRIAGQIVADDVVVGLEEEARTNFFTPQDLVLEDGVPVKVLINSVGGDVHAASEIYTRLKSHDGPVTVQIVGLAASAASVIAMAGDVVEMSPTAQMMIHNARFLSGEDDVKARDILNNINQSIANAYILKTGKTLKELLALMKQETWMTAKQALEAGFVDSVMFAGEALQLVASLAPERTAEKVDEVTLSDESIEKLACLVADKLAPKSEGGFSGFRTFNDDLGEEIIYSNDQPIQENIGWNRYLF